MGEFVIYGSYGYTGSLVANAADDRVLDGDAPTGFQTPAGANGTDLILDVDGVEREDVV
ncbi:MULTISPECIES: hypothetical protein [Haloarcula]|uniref:Uncharacterized protein n=1 Tax=Haloarcula pellucida TaxID=1427151 RepID=A0A830GJ16_9EURY|nr:MULTISPECIES: hypothetical protein [Halomicroarcula]MBX0346957.1 hypothetical protein [Halomicroarcula pellucida]MDS0277168.1 hypothetical protein [Halomicroarcula sp. S1AR25-4]GGN86265.1 hypothetical protein GCM10009030_03780 [Halomicroarcula pellucida]